MPWSNQSGGGGGGGGGGEGPWSGGSGGSGPQPPDLEEMLRKGFGKDVFEELNREFSKSGFRSGGAQQRHLCTGQTIESRDRFDQRRMMAIMPSGCDAIATRFRTSDTRHQEPRQIQPPPRIRLLLPS